MLSVESASVLFLAENGEGPSVRLRKVMDGTPVMPTDETKLPGALAAGIEALTGLRMDSVRVHHESSEPAEVPGQDRHLAHGAWHVIGDSPAVRLQKADKGEAN